MGPILGRGRVDRQKECKLYALAPRLLFFDVGSSQLNEWETGCPDILIGMAGTAQECLDFAKICRAWAANVCIFVFHSEAIQGSDFQTSRVLHFWFDADMLNDVVSGSRNVRITAGKKCESLRRTTSTCMPDILAQLYRGKNHQRVADASGQLEFQPVANLKDKMLLIGVRKARIYTERNLS